MMNGPIRDLIWMPGEEDASEIARRFEKAHFVPQVMGLKDGTHILILPTSDGYKDFVNRKGWPLYVLHLSHNKRLNSFSSLCKGRK